MMAFRNLVTLTAVVLALGASQRSGALYDVYAIQYGVLKNFRMSSLIADGDPAGQMDMSLMMWLLKGAAGRNVLVDAGFHRDDVVQRLKPVDFFRPSDAVARFGIAPEAVTDIVLSHIHF